jgi:succinate-acetate transporter protein
MEEKSIEIAGTETIKAPIYSNPAAVGLAGFGGTTLLLQFVNLGFVGSGVVIWMGLFFGGLAQLIAGFQEFKTGNNFGFAAFTSYGAFWLAVAGIFFTLNTELFNISETDVGWFMVVFTLLTIIFLAGAMKQNSILAFVFLTLLIGFVLLDIFYLGGVKAWLTAGSVVLVICGLLAWYLMAHVILTPLGIKIPVGKPWM